MSARGLGLALGFTADLVLGDPRRLHPVAGFGSLATRLERRTYADSRGRGAVHVAVLVGGCTGLGLALERVATHRPVLRVAVLAAATWTVLGGRSLAREADRVRALIDAGDLPGARRRLSHLVGRDTSGLDDAEVARAVVESVAENTADAVVAPLLWGALAGVPGLLAYRAANTLDAMVGHHSPRYERFGWAAARLDDVLNLPAARVTGVLGILAASDRRRLAWQAWRRDARRHPSPNAGVPEAVFAGALGIRLGGANSYGDHVERRAPLGRGRTPRSGDVIRAARLARRVDLCALAVAVAVAQLMQRRGGSP